MWNLFKKKPVEKPEVVVYEEEYDEIKEIKKAEVREKRQLMRERLQLDLERKRLENEVEIERLRWEKDQIAQKRIEFQESQYEEDGEEEAQNPEDMMTQLLLKAFSQGQPQQNNTHTTNTAPASNAPTNLNDDALRAVWGNMPASDKAVAKLMNDDQLRERMISQNKNLDSDTINRAIELVRSS